MARMTDHRRAEVRDALEKLRAAILIQIRPDGGFPPGSCAFNCYVEQAAAGKSEEPALWCTLFRYLTLALMEITLNAGSDPAPWDFRGIFHSSLYPTTCGLMAPAAGGSAEKRN
jgi:hypothetical protein